MTSRLPNYMFNCRHYAVFLLSLIILNMQYSSDFYLENQIETNYKTSENNADPTLESLRAVHVKDDHFILPNNFITLDFTITNSSDYIFAGYFSGTVMLNSTHTLTSNSTSEDILVLKTDFNGTVIDYFHAGGSGDDRARGMDVDPSGNVYLGGYMGGNISIGNTNYLTDDREGLVMKLDPSFSPVWSNNVTTHGNGNEIADVDWGSVDSIAIAGNCEGTKVNGAITSISFGTTVTYKRCGTYYKSSAPLTYNGYPLGGIGTSMYVGKLNATGDWQWAQKTEGCSVGYNGCSTYTSSAKNLDVYSTNIWHDSDGKIVAQGRSIMSSATNGNNWCNQANSYRGLIFGNYLIKNACSPGIFVAKLTSSGTVYKIGNAHDGWGNGASDFDGEAVLDGGQFAFYTENNRQMEHGNTLQQTSGPCTGTSSSPIYHITWMNESLCTRDGYSRFGGTGTIEDVSLTSGNSSEPQIIVTFLGAGAITLGSNNIVLTTANTPIVGQINTSNGSASATGFGWGWSFPLPSYAGYTIQGTEVSELGEIHIILRSGRDTVLRITNDTDGDGVGKYSDKFPNDSTQWDDFDNDGFGDQPTGNNPDGCVTQPGNSIWPVLGCPDYDGDRWSDSRDRFPGDNSQWNDTDWDGYGDNTTGFQPDSCPNTYGASNRNAAGAINGNGAVFGCLDTDFDGFSDTIDNCTNQYGDSVYGITDGQNVSYIGCSDSDRDGYADIDDPCSLQYGSSWFDRLGCADTDADGISDLRDPSPNSATNNTDDWDEDGYTDLRTWTNADTEQYWINGTDVFPNDASEWNDSDNDGFGDNSDVFPNDANESSDLDEDGIGDNADKCMFEPGNSTDGDSLGCPDRDGDGWADMSDAFPYNPYEWLDSDTDGVGDNSDAFPNDATENEDSDEDGVGDNADVFPDDPSETEDSDEDGVGDNSDAFPNDATETEDSDGDGVGDNADVFPDDSSETEDSDGDGVGDNADEFDFNPLEWIDSDNDLVGDNEDVFPFDPSEFSDRDVDGIGDNSDMCPDFPGNLITIPIGCPDADKDGYADQDDKFKDDPNEWNDTDMDGFGDNTDDCIDAFGNSTSGKIGCIDTDGDKWADSNDVWPFNKEAWSDADGDGFTDQLKLGISDDCPSQNGTSTITMIGCRDIDNDGIPDILDPDADGDGILNTWEYQMDPITNPFDASEKPLDYDNDGIPDYYDDDDDGDGFPDSIEERRGTDPLDPDSEPLGQYGGGTFYIPGEGFSSQYDPDGYELSLGAFIDLITSIFLAPILIATAAFTMMLNKKRRFNRISNDIENADDVAMCKDIEDDINDLMEHKRLKMDQALLLNYLLERKQNTLSDFTPEFEIISDEVDEKVIPKIKDITTISEIQSIPPIDADAYAVKDGYEYITWPENSSNQWYRIAKTDNKWEEWVGE